MDRQRHKICSCDKDDSDLIVRTDWSLCLVRLSEGRFFFQSSAYLLLILYLFYICIGLESLQEELNIHKAVVIGLSVAAGTAILVAITAIAILLRRRLVAVIVFPVLFISFLLY